MNNIQSFMVGDSTFRWNKSQLEMLSGCGWYWRKVKNTALYDSLLISLNTEQ